MKLSVEAVRMRTRQPGWVGPGPGSHLEAGGCPGLAREAAGQENNNQLAAAGIIFTVKYPGDDSAQAESPGLQSGAPPLLSLPPPRHDDPLQTGQPRLLPSLHNNTKGQLLTLNS